MIKKNIPLLVAFAYFAMCWHLLGPVPDPPRPKAPQARFFEYLPETHTILFATVLPDGYMPGQCGASTPLISATTTASSTTYTCMTYSNFAHSQATVSVCDDSLWKHVYNPQRLQRLGCKTVTGVKQDATHGKIKDGCRREADGDSHCWLKLDDHAAMLDDKNRSDQSGNLVFEPMCQHPPKQADTIKQGVCKDWTQKLLDARPGTRLRITGEWVLDTQHGHMEIHPVTSIEALGSGLTLTPSQPADN